MVKMSHDTESDPLNSNFYGRQKVGFESLTFSQLRQLSQWFESNIAAFSGPFQ
jgi:hypothetical protein